MCRGRGNLIQFQRLCDCHSFPITCFCFTTLRLPRPRFAQPRNDRNRHTNIVLHVIVPLAPRNDRTALCIVVVQPPLAPWGRGCHAVTGEGLLHRPDCKIPEQVRDDKDIPSPLRNKGSQLDTSCATLFPKRSVGGRVRGGHSLRNSCKTLKRVQGDMAIVLPFVPSPYGRGQGRGGKN